MTEPELRALQDRWLEGVRAQVRERGEWHGIAGPGTPTYRDVREMPLPAWAQWFQDDLGEAE